jgi:hypothetical protein
MVTGSGKGIILTVLSSSSDWKLKSGSSGLPALTDIPEHRGLTQPTSQQLSPQQRNQRNTRTKPFS